MAAGGAAALMMVMTGCNGSYGSSCGQAYVGLFAYMGLEIYSGYDAATNAGKINRARGLAFSVTPERQAGETSVRASATYSIDF